jgi:uncharacterized protein
VGADVNTASVPLLSRISGLSAAAAQHIVSFREEHGPFNDRQQLLRVPRIGARTFQQAAGFLRVADGRNPLDRSAVHPEAYPVVERIVAKTGVAVRDLIGNTPVLRTLRPDDFADTQFGVPTVRDILLELEKPGRDPRPVFRTASFREGVHEMAQLEPGMMLEGVVTNVANFGAFVDVGVHQDGLVHISQLADRFVKDAHEVVKAGDVVTVRVVEVDLKRRRIALSMRRDESAAAAVSGTRPDRAMSPPSSSSSSSRSPASGSPPAGSRQQPPARPSTSMAAAFEKLR